MSLFLSVVLLMLGLYQVYVTLNTFKYLKTEANRNVSYFMPIALYSGGLMALMMIGFGLWGIFNL
ncbi:hypothetical protein [Latilactobacillus sakei]|uniref:hypothetical protein n=1 Tax=Latilactobacillus sakei TaxID=1599 RepID=UPI000DC64748|nr:hypothetical protein [Latilactobacillus sakei]SPS03912.1 hypothetical protein LAS9624_00738 [Latilactobacillus sakei]